MGLRDSLIGLIEVEDWMASNYNLLVSNFNEFKLSIREVERSFYKIIRQETIVQWKLLIVMANNYHTYVHTFFCMPAW